MTSPETGGLKGIGGRRRTIAVNSNSSEIENHNSLGHERPSGLDVISHPMCRMCLFANTGPHQLCWGDWECGYHICTCICTCTVMSPTNSNVYCKYEDLVCKA